MNRRISLLKIALAALVAGAAALVYAHDEASTTNAGESAGTVMAASEAAARESAARQAAASDAAMRLNECERLRAQLAACQDAFKATKDRPGVPDAAIAPCLDQ